MARNTTHISANQWKSVCKPNLLEVLGRIECFWRGESDSSHRNTLLEFEAKTRGTGLSTSHSHSRLLFGSRIQTCEWLVQMFLWHCKNHFYEFPFRFDWHRCMQAEWGQLTNKGVNCGAWQLIITCHGHRPVRVELRCSETSMRFNFVRKHFG